MTLPFTAYEFFDVFRQYNEETWPLQLALPASGVAVACLLVRRQPAAGRSVNVLLAFLWGWMALVYHLLFFLEINRAALVFAIAFFVQAALFGVYARRLAYEIPRGPRLAVGAALVGYGLVVYPLLSLALGSWPEVPVFGVPCPTTIFTVGVLCFLRAPFPRHVFVVPVLWAAVGSAAIVEFGLLQDLGLVAAGVAGLVLMLRPQEAHKVAYS